VKRGINPYWAGGWEKRDKSNTQEGGFINNLKYAKLGLEETMKKPRAAKIKRETKETRISLEFNLDGSGKWQIDTGLKMFDHLLSQLVQHGRFDLNISASGDDPHHLIEDVAICLGRALSEALGEKRGITRMGDASVPMDDALAMVAVDISGRGYTVLELPFSDNDMAGFPTDLIRHFLESFAAEARLNLHARILYGINDHHKAEALFKALGRALDTATRIDQRLSDELPTTKGLLED
jgi:imidazoleglycerol-phosphate dehydratase